MIVLADFENKTAILCLTAPCDRGSPSNSSNRRF